MNSSKEIDIKDLEPVNLPAHVAIIMDGNGRWAKKRLMNRITGHEKGSDTVREIVKASREIGIKVLTLYAFSTENWQRPKTEVSALMTLLERFLIKERNEMLDNNIRLNAIGQLERLPKKVFTALQESINLTEKNDKMILNLALSYGGREEIVRMTREISQMVKSGSINENSITPELVSQHLYTGGMPDPDILIRPGGEMRISNFLLWQISYAEIFVTDTLWPDFSREEYIKILKDYQSRERRFGKVE
ncbi:MAG: isoprenyl transferase [Desulfobacterales bacterium]|nr:isoprenyl transferase [Desulfobacteraceae bacterium]MBT4365775.1 isoprenyl transferase [Desulfobacteraceae bacterium]MBT7086402.1 isoprenyl transferase [Desulfobacterales bacterium]